MLDSKHENIGATVSMINIIAQKEADEIAAGESGGFGALMAKAMLGDVDKLFMAESGMCDYQVITEGANQCHYSAKVEIREGATVKIDVPGSPVKCCVGECPLGALVDKKLKVTADSIQTVKPNTNPDAFRGSDNFSHHSLAANFADFGERREVSPEWRRAVVDHIHIGYTGWRKYWHNTKCFMHRHWDGIKANAIKFWKYYLVVLIVVISVDRLSKWAGTLSGYLF